MGLRQEQHGVGGQVDLALGVDHKGPPPLWWYVGAVRVGGHNLRGGGGARGPLAIGIGPQIPLVLVHEFGHRPTMAGMRHPSLEPSLHSLWVYVGGLADLL